MRNYTVCAGFDTVLASLSEDVKVERVDAKHAVLSLDNHFVHLYTGSADACYLEAYGANQETWFTEAFTCYNNDID